MVELNNLFFLKDAEDTLSSTARDARRIRTCLGNFVYKFHKFSRIILTIPNTLPTTVATTTTTDRGEGIRANKRIARVFGVKCHLDQMGPVMVVIEILATTPFQNFYGRR